MYKGQLISKAIYGLLTLLFYSSWQTNQIRPFVFWENLRLANLLFDFISPLIGLNRYIFFKSIETYTANDYRQTTDKLMFKSVISTIYSELNQNIEYSKMCYQQAKHIYI